MVIPRYSQVATGAFLIVSALLFVTVPLAGEKNGIDILIHSWKKEEYSFVTIPGRLVMALYVWYVLHVARKILMKKNPEHANPGFLFALPALWLICFALAVYPSMSAYDQLVDTEVGFRPGFAGLLLCAFLLAFMGYWLEKGRPSLHQENPVRVWLLRILCLIGLIYPAIAWGFSQKHGVVPVRLLFGPGTDTLNSIWNIAGIYLVAAVLIWIGFSHTRLGRRFMLFVGVMGLIQMIMAYSYPAAYISGIRWDSFFTGTNFAVMLHLGTPYLIFLSLIMANLRQPWVNCPKCKIYCSGDVVSAAKAGSSTIEYVREREMTAEEYRDDNPSSGAWDTLGLPSDARVLAKEKIRRKLDHYNCRAVCRECGHSWKFTTSERRSESVVRR